MAALLLSACHKEAPKPVVVPEVFRVKFQTSKGDFVVEARRAWAPHGVDRFHELVRMKYFDQGRFFRVVPGFIAQFGVHRDFNVHGKWREYFIVDDPPQQKNLRGTLAYAMSGPEHARHRNLHQSGRQQSARRSGLRSVRESGPGHGCGG